MKLRVLGVAGGNGVILHPFKKYLIGNIETRSDFKTPNDIQWKLNFGDIPLTNKPGNFPLNKVNVIMGCPDCGHSSVMAYSRGKKLGNPKKNESLNNFIESVNFCKPDFFFFENLPALFKGFPESEFNEQFKDYKLIKHITSVASYGNSQMSRVRLAVIGIRKGRYEQYSSIFKLKPTEIYKLRICIELESNLKYPNKKLCHVREDDNTIVCMEKDFKKLSLKEVKRIWNLPENKNRKKWDATTTGKGNMKNLPGVYRNLPDDFPLTARKQNRQFNSKGDIMSPRELGRIQGVTDDFKIWYDENKSQYSINKGRITVTKTAPYEMGIWFYKKIMKIKKLENKDKS